MAFHISIRRIDGSALVEIGLPLSLTVGSERYNGYVRALERHGLSVQSEFVHIGDAKQCSGLTCARELLDLKPPVTALFVANNLMTLGAIEAVRERRLAIPLDKFDAPSRKPT